METKIMDFKHVLTPNNNTSNKQDFIKNKNFNSKLESVNNKIHNYRENYQNPKKTYSEISSSIDVNSDKNKDTERLDLDCEEKVIVKNDYQIGYEGMMFLFANTLEIRPDDAISEDSQLDIGVNIDVDVDTEDFVLKNNIISKLDIPEELIVEEKTKISEILKPDEIKEYITREPESDKESNFFLDNKKNNIINIESKIDVSIPMNKAGNEIQEELPTNGINNSINNIQIIKDNDLNNLYSKDESEESTSNQEEVIIKTIDQEDDLDIKNKPFSFIEKNEIITDNVIEVDEADTIDRKDLIQQIVDKVKIDLSESKNEIRIKLKPEVLGEMTMNIEVVKGEIIAKIMVDSQRTKEIIEANLIQLKDGIKDTALEIKTFEVFVGSGSDFDKHKSNQFTFKQNNKKIKIKPENNKISKNYEENLLENQMNSTGIYSENGLNLFA